MFRIDSREGLRVITMAKVPKTVDKKHWKRLFNGSILAYDKTVGVHDQKCISIPGCVFPKITKIVSSSPIIRKLVTGEKLERVSFILETTSFWEDGSDQTSHVYLEYAEKHGDQMAICIVANSVDDLLSGLKEETLRTLTPSFPKDIQDKVRDMTDTGGKPYVPVVSWTAFKKFDNDWN